MTKAIRLRDPSGRFLADDDILQIAWPRQNEECESPGILLSSPASFHAEIRWLRSQGAPDTDKIELIDELVKDRDDSDFLANAPARFARWLISEGIIEQEDIEWP